MSRRLLLGCIAAPGLSLVGVPTSTLAQAAPALARCAGLADSGHRLDCYDQLAREQGLTVATEPAGDMPPAASVPGAASPPAPTTPASPGSPSPGSVASPTAVMPAGRSASAFGLYNAEHPRAPEPPQAKTLSAKVVAIGGSSNGHPTVTLEGNQLWELDGTDPMLAIGQTVSISRAALRSFLLTTSSGRSYRARRLH
jgi:hypothetical protein